MSTFADTSAFLSVLNAEDERHAEAARVWTELLDRPEELVSTNYVLVETLALVQRRFGLEAVRDFQADVVPLLRIEWVDEMLHQAGVAALLTAGRRRLSLVDCVSFEVMRRLGLRTAFALDEDFLAQGFTCLP